jgi:hypothetical protein
MHKKYFVFLFVFIQSMGISAQVFNSAEVLRPGHGSIGINPVFIANGENDLALYLHGGIGLASGLDLAAKLGIGDGTYFGMDLEYLLRASPPYVSIAGGGHIRNDAGIDATLNLTFPISRILSLYSGLDADINFAEGQTLSPLWIFLGNEVPVKHGLSFLLEIQIGVTEEADNRLGAGLNIYL